MGSTKTLEEQLKKEDEGFQGKCQICMLYNCIQVIGDKKGKINPHSTA
jgi:hypothetical protein